MTSRLSRARHKLLTELQSHGLDNNVVLDAMDSVARESFVAGSFEEEAYADKCFPIGHQQTISSPYVVGWMTHKLDVQKTHKVLEIGTGSGYQTAILCKLARRVYTVERVESLSQSAEKRLHAMGFFNFSTEVGDGSLGWKNQAPFDRIMVTATSPTVPQNLIDQLAPTGIMVIPVGHSDDTDQRLMKITKDEEGQVTQELLGYVKFVPLVGEQGHTDKDLKSSVRSS